MKRGLIKLLAMLLLLVCLATAGLWGRSYFIKDEVFFLRGPGRDKDYAIFRASVGSLPGRLEIKMAYRDSGGVVVCADDGGQRIVYTSAKRMPPVRIPTGGGNLRPRNFAFADHAQYSFEVLDNGRYSTMRVPHWSVLAIAGLPVIWWLGRALLGRRRRRVGLCRTCGYDLRATPERCPECGTATAQNAVSA